MNTALGQVIALVREVARAEITPRYLRVAHSHKNDGSLFTEADAATQKALMAALPDIIATPVLGEEMTEAEQRAAWAAGENGLWCIDPIDGTSNFVAGIPYFAISIAWLRNGRRELGVVYDTVKAGLDGGVNWFDTAELYGNGVSEKSLSTALKAAGIKDDDVIIATKWWPLFRTARNIPKTIHERLRYLDGYSIGLYQVHQPFSFSSPEAEMDAMAELVKAGMIRSVGVRQLQF